MKEKKRIVELQKELDKDKTEVKWKNLNIWQRIEKKSKKRGRGLLILNTRIFGFIFNLQRANEKAKLEADVIRLDEKVNIELFRK